MVALQVSLFVVVASVVMQYFFWVSGLVSRTSLRQSGSDIGVGGRDTLRGTLGRLSEMMWSQLGITRSGQATTTSSGRLGSLITGCWVARDGDGCLQSDIPLSRSKTMLLWCVIQLFHLDTWSS